MKKRLSGGALTVLIIEIVISVLLIAVFVSVADKINFDQVGEDERDTMPFIVGVCGFFKLLGAILMLAKKKLGQYFLLVPSLILIYLGVHVIIESDMINNYNNRTGGIVIILALLLQIFFLIVERKASKKL